MAFGKSLEMAAIQPGPGKWLAQGKGATYRDPLRKQRKSIRAERLAKNRKHAQAKRRARRLAR